MVSMSARRGTFSRMSGSSLSRQAAISGRAAFLAPPIAMRPRRGVPPTMRIRSIKPSKPRQRYAALTHIFAGPVGIGDFAGLVRLQEQELACALVRIDLRRQG